MIEYNHKRACDTPYKVCMESHRFTISRFRHSSGNLQCKTSHTNGKCYADELDGLMSLLPGINADDVTVGHVR